MKTKLPIFVGTPRESRKTTEADDILAAATSAVKNLENVCKPTGNEDETANLVGTPKLKSVTCWPLPGLKNLGSRQGQPSLKTSIRHVVAATLESLNAKEQRQWISDIFNLLSKYTASSTSPSSA
ncbi:hypothetical protein AVEN_210772-1 [Araneus ventricosus]|uniref:Uncharacterized protein n=1 Tax=Araneus ventricosus TaxID=182803 RepID=A0A4Y2PMK7_ARAVE|nr:hypothetical protein AVEN_210772-1 [Araneus ventricosus]